MLAALEAEATGKAKEFTVSLEKAIKEQAGH